MDSKLRRIAIFASLAVILAVSAFVLYTNRKPGPQNKRPPVSGQEQTAAPSASPEENVPIAGQVGDDLSAFMKDPSFFDTEISPVLEAAKELADRLSLIVTSVEKDLRVQVVDGEGVPVAGKSFLVKLERADASPGHSNTAAGEGIYKDLDQDGIIYIGDLDAGEYYVGLQPLEGYRVPADETRVRVKDRVEYLAIEDISLLIKTEDQVDAEAEDSGEKDALADADKSEIKELKAFTGRTKAGIDVSKWQGEIDWDKVKNAGVEFAIVRSGYRGSVTGSLVQDPCFDKYMKGAAASGIPVGVYFFTQATNEVEAVEEASAVIQWVKEYSLEYPIFIDTEGAGGNGRADSLDADTRTLVCEAFCRTVENAGYQGGVYASRNWYNHNLHAEKLEDYYIWLAEYRSVPLYQGYYRMWQHTSKGRIDGISGNVDMNVMYE